MAVDQQDFNRGAKGADEPGINLLIELPQEGREKGIQPMAQLAGHGGGRRPRGVIIMHESDLQGSESVVTLSTQPRSLSLAKIRDDT